VFRGVASLYFQACLCCCAVVVDADLLLMVDNIFETKRSAASFIPWGSIRKIGEEVPYLYKSASMSESPSLDFILMAEDDFGVVLVEEEEVDGVFLFFFCCFSIIF